MRHLALALTLASLCPITTEATTQATTTLQASPASTGCPVSLAVERRSPSEVVEIDGTRHPGAGQGLHLSISPTPSTFVQISTSPILSIEAVVSAFSAKPRLFPVRQADPEPDIHRTFHLTTPSDHPRRTESELWLDRAASILSVDLTSITFADGTTWRHSSTSICHATPNGFLLVDATASH